ncbi:MAG: hypothetical protein DRQ49_06130 [Gammaproteobacteria bacterium]|nr:MAG: hypothetical protein DRQ49_06130 [Gammaproteobacteria bacterium]
MNKGTVKQRLFIVALVVSIGFLLFVAGIATRHFKLWPSQIFEDAEKAARSWNMRLRSHSRYDNPSMFPKVRHEKGGIFQYNAEKAYNGFTLFTSRHSQIVLLISMEGEIVHEWHFPFSSVWTNPPHIAFPVSDDFITGRKAHLYPNGDLLAIYVGNGDTPWGYGLVKIDKNSKVIWKYAEHVHHDVDVGSDGKIYTLIQEITTEKIPGIALAPPMIEDSIVILSPQGQELKRLSISNVFRNSDFSSILKWPANNSKGDIWHTNTVEVLDKQFAALFPFLKEGQVLVSMRNVDTIAVIDLDNERVVWATRGPWHWQHDPDFLSNGNMLIFDNLGHRGKGGESRIIEFDPMTMEIIWQYTGDDKDILFSRTMSSQQRLPNGNTLITESKNGRILEVTREKEIVWEFLTPFRVPNEPQRAATINGAQRFHPDSLNFEFSNLKQNSP